MNKGLYFSGGCLKYSNPPFKWFLSKRHGANNWGTSVDQLQKKQPYRLYRE